MNLYVLKVIIEPLMTQWMSQNNRRQFEIRVSGLINVFANSDHKSE